MHNVRCSLNVKDLLLLLIKTLLKSVNFFVGTSTTLQLVLIDTVELCGTIGSDESDSPPAGTLDNSKRRTLALF